MGGAHFRVFQGLGKVIDSSRERAEALSDAYSSTALSFEGWEVGMDPVVDPCLHHVQYVQI